MANITFKGNPMTLLGEEVRVGMSAPNFTALKKDLSPCELYSFKDKIKVITAFPSLDTAVCAMQVRKFNADLGNINPKVVVLPVSMDLPFAQARFCTTEGLEHVIALSDHKDADFGLKYGFLIKELRLLSRGTVIVDEQNIIKYAEYVPEVTDAVNFDAAINIVKNLTTI